MRIRNISTCLALLLLGADGFVPLDQTTTTLSRRIPQPTHQPPLGMVVSSTAAGNNEKRAAAAPRRQSKRKPQQNMSYIEREIVRLGRRGQTDQALALFDSTPRPSVRVWNAAIDACARARPTRLDQAFELLEKSNNANHNGLLKPNVFTFGAIMSACARARQADRAVQVLRSMQSEYGVKPNAVVYSSAISACARSNPPAHVQALQLLEECTSSAKKNLEMSVVGYNAALSACARAGAWQPAIDLLERMVDQNIADGISYGTVLSACEKGEQWSLVLKYAQQMQQNDSSSSLIVMDALSVTSCLHACQQLGLADEALRYLTLMKTSPQAMVARQTAGWQRKGVRQPLSGPDGVAYRLAISACARGNYHEAGIELLEEMRANQIPLDVMAYTSAITGCEYAGEWRKAFTLLDMMRREDGIEPNEVTMAAVIGSCATACAKLNSHGEQRQQQQQQQQKETNNIYDDDEEKIDAKQLARAPMIKALQLFQVMKKDPTVVNPNTIVYNAAIRTCAEAMELDLAMKLMKDLEQQEGLEPTIVTYGSLMTACERVGSLKGITKVFTMMRQAEVTPNEIIYGAAISGCRKAGDAERAMLLLRKMIRDGLKPNVATFNTVIIAQTEGRKAADLSRAALAYKLMKNDDIESPPPNRQTYNILIRALNQKLQPQGAEFFLRKMQQDGFKPDVDLYTSTVTAYERNGQPLKALRLMESMQEVGYDYYEVKVLNTAFKNAVKLVNTVVSSENKQADGVEQDWELKLGDDSTEEANDFIHGSTAPKIL